MPECEKTHVQRGDDFYYDLYEECVDFVKKAINKYPQVLAKMLKIPADMFYFILELFISNLDVS